MALTKDKKNQVINEVKELLNNSKMTVVASYTGTPVKALQSLRKQGKSNNTTIKVIKNRLVLKAIESTEADKNINKKDFSGMLLYAFNADDEVAPAQILAKFAKDQPTIEFVGAISSEGKYLTSDEVKALSTLPSKNELIAQVMATLDAPLNDVTSAISGNLHGILSSIEQKAN